MAGTSSISSRVYMRNVDGIKEGERISITWTADASAATIPDLAIPGIKGFIAQIITDPGATAPTALYDIALYHPSAADLDILGGALADRSATITEVKAPVLSGATLPVYVNGDYTMKWTNNAVNSATGLIYIEVLFL
jgi:hypothetical protein